jgi:hypothetical protein
MPTNSWEAAIEEFEVASDEPKKFTVTCSLEGILNGPEDDSGPNTLESSCKLRASK